MGTNGDNNAEQGYLFNRYYGKYIHHISALLLYHIGVNLLKTVSNHHPGVTFDLIHYIRGIINWEQMVNLLLVKDANNNAQEYQICRRVLAIIDLSKLTNKFDKDGDNEFKDGTNNNNDNQYKYDDNSKEEEKQLIDNSNNTKNKPKNYNINNNNKFKDANNDNGVSVDTFTCILFKKRLHIANNE